MFSLYLTPAALGYLTQLILTALISGYFVFLVWRHKNPLSHLRWLTTFFVSLTAFIATLFLEAALAPTPRLYAVFLQVPLLSVSWLCMAQFAYRFPTLPASLRREAQVSLWVSSLYILWETGYAVFRFIRLQAGVVEYRIDWTDYLLSLFLLWPAVVCIREVYRLTPTEGNFYDLSEPRALRFTPEAGGGYRIDTIPYAFETAPGRDLRLDDGLQRGCSEALDFAFSFYGQVYREVYICNDGMISLGRLGRYRELQYHYGAGTPLLIPLLLDLDPTTSPGGVFVRQETDRADTDDRLIVTWERLRGYRQPQAEFTFQAVLCADGRFDFIYAELPERLTFRPNDGPGASLWAIGALPGNLHSPGQAILTGNLPVHSGPEGIIQDFHLNFRRHLQRLLAPVAGLILAASAFIAGGFPLLFYVSLVGPLNTLLKGAQRIEDGEYNFVMPEQAPDEIGVLTRMFNSLTAQVGDLINTLEARVASRTAALDTANAQLRAEIVEREQAQMALMEQQRLLARYEERESMGRELHDGLGQVMGYINVQAQAAQTFLQNGQIEAAQNALADLIPAAQDAHSDIRAHILGLRAREKAPQDYLSTLRDLLEQFGRQHHIVTRLSAPEPFPPAIFAPAVEEQVARILQEGLANIRKHARAQRVEVTLSFIGDYVQIVLADDGVGFSILDFGFSNAPVQNQKSEIQNHFGLQIMRERAELVGGTLEVRSAPGEGTRLLLTVPRFVPTVEDADGASLQNVRILLADDHPLFLDGLRNLLVARGLNVIGIAHDGNEVQEKARALHPDVVVMDVNMPKCDGLTATRAIKAEFPAMKILMLTAAEDERVLFEAIKAGASGYLLKNLDANRFCAAITDLLRDETPIAPGLAGRMLAEFARLASTPVTAASATAATPGLTPQQWDILRQVAEGRTYKEIATAMYVTEQTVKYHMNQILTRLQVENRAQAIAYYRQTRG